MKSIITIENATYNEWPKMVRNDWGIPIVFTIRQNDGNAFNLTGYEVRFKAKKFVPQYEYDENVNKINSLCVINNYTSGIATYTVEQGDFDTAGKFYTEVECSSASSIFTAKLGFMEIEKDLPN